MTLTDEGHYGPKQLNLLKTIWGEGFLSPGGSEEIDEIVKNIDVKNLKILDIGCGCGGAALHLVNSHNASFVTGIDVEPLVIQRAKELASKRGLSDKTKFEIVSPGPLSFEDQSIDMIFSKETFLHIPDKEELFEKIFKILKPNGIIAVGDWMRVDDNPPSPQMKSYIEAEGLDMYMCSLERYESILKNTGFKDIQIRDRNNWYLEKSKKEIIELRGPLYQAAIDAIGPEETEGAIQIWEKLIGVLEIGEHRPGHFTAIKP
tara:strand:+ start:365 stop:1147 length:783 start_codon:yes stop_codon:yes gene_type:complete